MSRRTLADLEAPDPPVVLPARSDRKPKRIKVRVVTGYKQRRNLTYHVYGARPKRGAKVRIRAGVYEGRLATVARRHSLYRGATFLAEVAHPKEWSP